METNEESRKPIPKRLYISCPVCGSIIMQAEGAKNVLLKCYKCHNMITIEVECKKVVTIAPNE